MNTGANITIAENILIYGYCYIQSSSHGYKKSEIIKKQKYLYKEIIVEEDAWIGAHSIIMPGVKISKGSIIGANSVVKSNTGDYEIHAGNPATKVTERI